MSNVQWSDWDDVGPNVNGDITVGLRDGVNVQFDPIIIPPSLDQGAFLIGAPDSSYAKGLFNSPDDSINFDYEDAGGGYFNLNTTVNATVVATLGNPNTYTSTNNFTAYSTFLNVETTYSTTSTIVSTDLLNKIIFCNPSVPITLTPPPGTDIDSDLQSPDVNQTVENISITNASPTSSVTLGNNTGCTIGGVPNPVIAPLTTRFFKLRKSTNSPAYILYG